MRLWSLHPQYLDRIGLVALWREALLAQKVLRGRTKGYRRHPQLERFKSHPRPLPAIAAYLQGVWNEASRRGYRFDRKKILRTSCRKKIPVTKGQLEYEFNHLHLKLQMRDREWCDRLKPAVRIRTHPLFIAKPGSVESWESI